MYASIVLNKDIRATIYYHTKKEVLHQCECLGAVNFVKDLNELSYKDKLHHFRHLTSLHESITYNVVHMSLNFHSSDRLSDQDMRAIAARHMEVMRLGDQPYLIYRHFDTAHPHVHLVSTNIRHDGELLKITKGDYYRTISLCKKIEGEYQLKVAGQRRRQEHSEGYATKIKHGEMPVMASLNKVLEKVLGLYKCTSLEEQNAVLRLYNVQAFKGSEGSKLYQRRGLVFRILGNEGKPVRGYVKASLFDSKPTLDRLERQFALNRADVLREQHRQRVVATLAWNMTKKGMDLATLEKELQRQRISVVWSKKRDSVFYVDHETKAVFDGARLGERYNASALRDRLVSVLVQEQVLSQHQHQRHRHSLKPGF